MSIKNITKIIIFIIAIVSLLSLINNMNNEEKIDDNYIKKFNPISKEHAVNILKAEYGNIISISEDEIKRVGDEYVVEVYTQFKGEEEYRNNDKHENFISLGIHKINIYTGELVLPN